MVFTYLRGCHMAEGTEFLFRVPKGKVRDRVQILI